ncbi:MAG: hypothetical protein HY943_07270 [Gammaproteobacteria bacterium]|nr:hypothetical protein [Gammaproteobacteria bacterium]
MRPNHIAALLLGCGLAFQCVAADYFVHTEWKYVSRKKLKPTVSNNPEDIYAARKAMEKSRYDAAKESCRRYESNNKSYCEKEKESEHMKLVRELENDYKEGKLVPPAQSEGAN